MPYLTAEIAETFEVLGNVISDVLQYGDLDDWSRQRLSGMCRGLNQASALITPMPELAVSRVDADSVNGERLWFDTWADHVGSMALVLRMGDRSFRALYHARLMWADEVDAMTDKELRRVPGIGPKSVAEIRTALDAYYWRADAKTSDAMWRRIAGRLENALQVPMQPRADRVRAGLEFARDVLEANGSQLSNRHAPRLAAM